MKTARVAIPGRPLRVDFRPGIGYKKASTILEEAGSMVVVEAEQEKPVRHSLNSINP
jgi:hypothetical protein